MNKSYAKEIVSAGLDHIKPVYIQLIKPKDIPNQQPPTTPFSANSSVSDSGVFLNNFFNDDDHTVESQAPNQQCRTADLVHCQCARFILEKAIEAEAIAFTELIGNNHLLESCKKSSIFWQKYTIKLPKLAELFMIINCIPAASAGIERYFNITGLINNDRRLRMKDDLVEIRSLFKVNLHILDELTTMSEDFTND
jgi:hypothetical protein